MVFGVYLEFSWKFFGLWRRTFRNEFYLRCIFVVLEIVFLRCLYLVRLELNVTVKLFMVGGGLEGIGREVRMLVLVGMGYVFVFSLGRGVGNGGIWYDS